MIVMIDAMVKAVQHVCAAGFLRRQTAGKSLADVKSSPFGRNDPGIQTGIFQPLHRPFASIENHALRENSQKQWFRGLKKTRVRP